MSRDVGGWLAGCVCAVYYWWYKFKVNLIRVLSYYFPYFVSNDFWRMIFDLVHSKWTNTQYQNGNSKDNNETCFRNRLFIRKYKKFEWENYISLAFMLKCSTITTGIELIYQSYNLYWRFVIKVLYTHRSIFNCKFSNESHSILQCMFTVGDISSHFHIQQTPTYIWCSEPVSKAAFYSIHGTNAESEIPFQEHRKRTICVHTHVKVGWMRIITGRM